jgi:hypothetical protein
MGEIFIINDRRFAIFFRSCGLLIALVGLLINMGFFRGEFAANMLMYYTIQSNILALVLFGVLLIKTLEGFRLEGKYGKTGYFPRFEMVCVFDLLLTLIAYWVLLAPVSSSMGHGLRLWSFGNLCVHLITPALCLIDYALFAESGHLKYRDVYAILIYPLVNTPMS